MSRFEFRLPDVAEGIHEAEIVTIHARVGDRVEEHDPMLDAMTDKATITIGAPRSGTILEIRASLGDVLKVGDVVVVLEVDSPPADTITTSASAVGDIRDSLPASHYFAGAAEAEPPATTGGTLATPAVRGRARDRGIALGAVVGSGPSGRILDEDLEAFAAQARGGSSSLAAEEGDVREPVVGLRRTIASRMQHAVTTAAHFTFVEECDVTALVALRAELAPRAAAAGVELAYLPFVARAVCLALTAHPRLASLYDAGANELVRRRAIHLGIATATPRGLVVPVVRDAERRSLLGLARAIAAVSEGARAGTLAPAAFSGSSFTITSLGKQGGLLATPVLNLPEVGILGVHRIKQRPVVRDGAIAIGDVLLLSLSCDHRFVDGDVAAAFAYDVIARLEDPASLIEPWDDQPG